MSSPHDFVHCRTDDGRAFRTLNILDEFTREFLAIRVRRRLTSMDVLDVLMDLFILRGIPDYIRSDNAPEFVARAVRDWIGTVGAKTAFIEPGSPLSTMLRIACRARHGRTGTVRASTGVYVTNCSTARSSILCERPRS